MGLDLFLVKSKYQIPLDDEFWYTDDKYKDVNSERNELAYGRKTWDIYEYFETICLGTIHSEDMFEVTKENWKEFRHDYKVNRKYVRKAKKCLKKLMKLEYKLESWKLDLSKTEEQIRELEAKYEVMYCAVEDVVSDTLRRIIGDWGGSQLGPIWEFVALLDFIYANRRVKKAFRKKEHVYIMASY